MRYVHFDLSHLLAGNWTNADSVNRAQEIHWMYHLQILRYQNREEKRKEVLRRELGRGRVEEGVHTRRERHEVMIETV